MKNIEIAAEDERVREAEQRWESFRGLAWSAGAVLGSLGWWLFYRGRMGPGAFLVTAALILMAVGWRVLDPRGLRGSGVLAGLLAALPPLVFYTRTRPPFFAWGKDPSFWLSVHAGAVVEPFWSPLSYLLGQAAVYLLPSRRFSLLPELTAVVLSAALFFLYQEYASSKDSKSPVQSGLAVLLCWLLGLSLPFWEAGTVGSGLPAACGFLLILLLRSQFRREEKEGAPVGFLAGLLWCVHPMWGLLGFLHFPAKGTEARSLRIRLFPMLVGLSPFLWIGFRAGKYFPSWGGSNPFFTLFSEWKTLWAAHLQNDWGWTAAMAEWGLSLAALGALVLLLLTASLFLWKKIPGPAVSPGDFWIWALSGAGAVLFYSSSSEALGPTALFFGAGLGGMFLALIERGTDPRLEGPLTGTGLSWTAAGCLVLALVPVFLVPGQSVDRSRLYFPEEHALNLLDALGSGAVLVCEDPFEASACREVRLFEPSARDTVILERKYLNRRWYLSQCVGAEPGLLISTMAGSTEAILQNLAADNLGSWSVHWGLSRLPEDWKGPEAFPTGLTQEFAGAGSAGNDPARAQYRFDLTNLPDAGDRDPQAKKYFERYVMGFDELGKSLMAQRRYSQAIRAFERSVKLDPSFREPQEFLAGVYSQENILEAAQLDFEKIVASHPGEIDGLMRELDQAKKDSNDEKTVGLLDQIVRLNAELADAQYQLSRIYEKQGRIPEARMMLEASVRRNPGQIEAQLSFGKLMSRMGNRIRAEDAFRAVLGVDPQNKEAQLELWKLLNQS